MMNQDDIDRLFDAAERDIPDDQEFCPCGNRLDGRDDTWDVVDELYRCGRCEDSSAGDLTPP